VKIAATSVCERLFLNGPEGGRWLESRRLLVGPAVGVEVRPLVSPVVGPLVGPLVGAAGRPEVGPGQKWGHL
jgi:hypothetical protein